MRNDKSPATVIRFTLNPANPFDSAIAAYLKTKCGASVDSRGVKRLLYDLAAGWPQSATADAGAAAPRPANNNVHDSGGEAEAPDLDEILGRF
ncbi:MAG: hypothetical protein HY804_07600 [Nitrospinae bacterium]|nr:hypothetical protein [Nitrospinota bacterium]